MLRALSSAAQRMLSNGSIAEGMLWHMCFSCDFAGFASLQAEDQPAQRIPTNTQAAPLAVQGRTAYQCLEHYEKLLDQAQALGRRFDVVLALVLTARLGPSAAVCSRRKFSHVAILLTTSMVIDVSIAQVRASDRGGMGINKN